MPPPRLKPPTKTRPEIVLDLKYKMQHMSKVEVFNTFVEFLTTLDIQGMAAALPAPAPAPVRAGQGTSTPVAAGTLAGATVPAGCPVCGRAHEDHVPDDQGGVYCPIDS